MRLAAALHEIRNARRALALGYPGYARIHLDEAHFYLGAAYGDLALRSSEHGWKRAALVRRLFAATAARVPFRRNGEDRGPATEQRRGQRPGNG